MDVDEIWSEIDAQRAGLADLLDGLTDRQWEVASLCEAWRVRDVAAHLTQAHTGTREALVGFARARGDFDRFVRDAALAKGASRPVSSFAPEVRAMIGSRRTAPFVTPMEPLLDVIVHGQDIALPLHIRREVPVGPAVACAHRLWAMGYPMWARRRHRGLRLVAEDSGLRLGEGDLVEGPTAALLLLLTGRHGAALPSLTGAGADRLRERLAPGGGQAAQRIAE